MVQNAPSCNNTKDAADAKNYSNFSSNLSVYTITRMGNPEKANPEKSFLKKAEASVRFSPLLRQVLASSGPIALTISSGMTSGYSAIMLPQLEEQNSTISVTSDQASWIASMAALPMALGCLLSGILLEKCGRRMTQIITAFPFMLGWLVIGMATNIEMILVGRFLTGLCVGLTGPASSVYIGETSDPKYRGFLLAAVSLAIAIGLFIAHLLGTFLSWPIVAYISILMPLSCIGLLFFVPESPTWLANKGQLKKAEEAFFWCRGHSLEAVEELAALMQKQTQITRERMSWSHFKKPEFWKPLLIINIFFVTTQFSGVNAVAFYSVSIMQDTVGEGMNKYVAMMIIDTIRLVMSVVACILTKKYGRRPLTNISSVGTAVSLVALASFLYASKMYPAIASFSAIPLGALISYIVFVTVGLVPLPWAMTGEVFPQSLRGVGSGISTSINFLAFFAVVKTSPTMTMYMQPYGSFLTYGCAALIGGVVLYLFLPETKGKTLQQIEDHFKGNQQQEKSEKSAKIENAGVV